MGSSFAGPDVSTQALGTLIDVNLDDLFDAVGLTRLRHTALQRLGLPSARRFARVAREFDDRVGDHGLAQGGSWLLHRMAGGMRLHGLERVPSTGPLVVVANHPGMTDTVALLAALAARPDLLVIALDRPFLRALPHVARHLIFVGDDPASRMTVLRTAARHLQQGGALLTFPAGEIEPDPAAFGRSRALESLQRWSDSVVLFARFAPQTRFVPALVSNVVSAHAQRHWLTWLRRTPKDKERLAAALQVALPRYQTLVARVALGPPQRAGADPASLWPAIVAQMHHLIDASGGDADRRSPPRQGERPGVPRPVA